jgi:hypothetical protein
MIRRIRSIFPGRRRDRGPRAFVGDREVGVVGIDIATGTVGGWPFTDEELEAIARHRVMLERMSPAARELHDAASDAETRAFLFGQNPRKAEDAGE